MKWFLCFLLLAPLVSAVSIEGYVNDYANILSSESSEIESILKSLHTQGSAEFAIVTINSLEGRDIDGYAFELAEGKLGDKEKNNGLLLWSLLRTGSIVLSRAWFGACLARHYRWTYWQDFLVPAFREGNYGRGILDAVKAVEARVSNNSSSEYYVSDAVPVNPRLLFLSCCFACCFYCDYSCNCQVQAPPQ